MGGAGLASASAGPAWECDNQRQDLIALDLGMLTLSQTARKDGAPAGSVKINVEISLRWIWECPPSREERGKGGATAGEKPTSGAKARG